MNTKIKWLYLTKLFFFMMIADAIIEQKPLVIFTSSRNNKDFYIRHLSSIFEQNYVHWRMIYVNDDSTDGTGQLVQQFIKEKGYQDKVLFVDNKTRRGHLPNQYSLIHTCAKNEIIVIVDGDDWLPHNNVFSYINRTYQDPNVWMTYGQFWYFKRNAKGLCQKIPEEYVVMNKIRDYPGWVLSHLRTFYAGLFQMIKVEDLLFEGDFYPMFADGATMYPMFEMAAERAKFIPDVLYVYNDDNPTSFLHTQREKQMEIRQHVLNRNRYQRLESLPFSGPSGQFYTQTN